MNDQDEPTGASQRTGPMGRGELRSQEQCRVWVRREERWKEKRVKEEVREVGVVWHGCSSITPHSGPGVGFSKTDSE